jgi:hypothetical protein
MLVTSVRIVVLRALSVATKQCDHLGSIKTVNLADCTTYQASFGAWDFKFILRTDLRKSGWVVILPSSPPSAQKKMVHTNKGNGQKT